MNKLHDMIKFTWKEKVGLANFLYACHMDITGEAKNKLICLLVTKLIIVRMNKKDWKSVDILSWLVIKDEIMKSEKRKKKYNKLLKREVQYNLLKLILYKLIYSNNLYKII